MKIGSWVAILVFSTAVHACTIWGRASDTYERGIRSASVFAVDVTDGGERSFIASHTLTNSFGYYRLTVPCDRDYELIAWHKRYTLNAWRFALLTDIRADFHGE